MNFLMQNWNRPKILDLNTSYVDILLMPQKDDAWNMECPFLVQPEAKLFCANRIQVILLVTAVMWISWDTHVYQATGQKEYSIFH